MVPPLPRCSLILTELMLAGPSLPLKMKHVVGIAGGGRKLEALCAALRGNLISTLITDERTAQALIQ